MLILFEANFEHLLFGRNGIRWLKAPSPMTVDSKYIPYWLSNNMHYNNVLANDNTNAVDICNETAIEILLCTPRSTSKLSVKDVETNKLINLYVFYFRKKNMKSLTSVK